VQKARVPLFARAGRDHSPTTPSVENVLAASSRHYSWRMAWIAFGWSTSEQVYDETADDEFVAKNSYILEIF